MNNNNAGVVFLLIVIMMLIQTIVIGQNVDNIPLLQSRFTTGDDELYKRNDFDDSKWEQQKLGEVWQAQGHADYHGYAWYRIHVVIPSSLKKQSFWKDSLRIFLAHVNDVDETFLNGTRVGHTGSFPSESGGYTSKWPAIREYHIPLSSNLIKWDVENVIAIKVYDGGGTGGIFMGQPYIDVLEKINGLNFKLDNRKIIYKAADALAAIDVVNSYNTSIRGKLQYNITDEANEKTIETKELALELKPFQKKTYLLKMPNRQGIAVNMKFAEALSNLTATLATTLPYILTPAVREEPSINGATVAGVQPGHPFIYKIPATGKAPLVHAVKNLPAGLHLSTATGIITGSIASPGDYTIQIIVKNKLGSAQKNFTIKAANLLALTPPMGWNSWNCWGISVSDEKVRSSANALIDKGLINHGWNYINVDDGWEAKQRAANGNIQLNEKFPDMKKLGDYLHNNGLRFGIYSSPGTHTCGGFLGSYSHELADATTYSEWGIDYLKYDLCSYLDSMKDNVSLADHQLPYKVMHRALQSQQRDIVYSICQYGIKDVWKWGETVNGNLWRTTEDIDDSWESMYNIGFKQDTLYKYAKPGRWNDPDMLTVGMVGWGENLHPTRLTVDEQYTQLSLWSMLSAPLLIGCDMSQLDPFTLNLLTNDEVIAIDQDALGMQAKKLIDKDSIQVWVKELWDGRKAVAVFNVNSTYKSFTLNLTDILMSPDWQGRDVWRKKNIGSHSKGITNNIPPHGVVLFTFERNK